MEEEDEEKDKEEGEEFFLSRQTRWRSPTLGACAAACACAAASTAVAAEETGMVCGWCCSGAAVW